MATLSPKDRQFLLSTLMAPMLAELRAPYRRMSQEPLGPPDELEAYRITRHAYELAAAALGHIEANT